MAKKKGSRRNAPGAGNIRKKIIHKNGQEYVYWEARLTVGFDPGTGKQIQRSFTGKTQKEVRERLQAAVKAKLFCPEIAGLFCRIAGLFCHDSRANLSLKPVCFGIAIS